MKMNNLFDDYNSFFGQWLRELGKNEQAEELLEISYNVSAKGMNSRDAFLCIAQEVLNE